MYDGSSVSAKTLEWKLEADQRYRIRVERTVQQKSPATEWTETISYDVLWVVTGRDSGGKMHITQSLTDVKHKLQFSNAKSVVYDSTSDVEPSAEAIELARYWKTQLGIERSLTLLPDGRLDPLEPADSSPPNGEAKPVDNGAARREPIQHWMTSVGWKLPSESVTVTPSWEESSLVPWRETPAAIRVTISYTYRGEATVDGTKLDKIDVQAVWDVQPRPAAPRQLRVDRQVGRGVIYFDSQIGCPVQSDFSQELVVHVMEGETESVEAEIVTALKIRCQPVVAEAESAETATAP